VASAYGLPAYPYWVFIGPDGKVVARAVGEISIPDLETEIGKLGRRIGEIDATLADPALYARDPARVATLAKERAGAAGALAAAEEQWLALSGEYESAGG